MCYHTQAVVRRHTYGRVVELVDSLDSGSSVHCGRAGSSPASPTKKERHAVACLSFLFGDDFVDYLFIVQVDHISHAVCVPADEQLVTFDISLL